MAYPTNLDSFDDPNGTSPLNTPSHSGLHGTINTAVEAIEVKLGVGAGSPVANRALIGSGNGTSGWTATWNNATFGTPAITGGTVANSLIGTSTIQGGTANNQVIGTPNVTGGTFSSPVMTSPSVTSGDMNLATGLNIQVNSTDPYRTISLMPGYLKPTTTAGCSNPTTVEAATNDIDYDVLDFDTSTDENAFANFHMPDSWDGGAVQFRYIWTVTGGTTSQTIQFELSGRSYANDDAIDQAVGSPVELNDTWIANGDVHISDWSSDVTLAGTPAAGQLVHLEIMRDVSDDNLAGDCRLMSLQLRYKTAQYSD